jgi:hypothetical protein
MHEAMAHKGLLGILKTRFAPPDDQGGMHLILACGQGGGLPRFDLPHHLQLELTGEATSFESQGCCLLSVAKEASLLRQTFVEWAAESIRQSFGAQVYYQQQRDKGKAHQAAVRALAFKWIRIL